MFEETFDRSVFSANQLAQLAQLALTQANTEVIVFPQGFNKLLLHLWFPRCLTNGSAVPTS